MGLLVRAKGATRSKVASGSKTLGIPANFGFRGFAIFGCVCLLWRTAAIGFEQCVEERQPNSFQSSRAVVKRPAASRAT
jgi:hypothetical protein